MSGHIDMLIKSQCECDYPIEDTPHVILTKNSSQRGKYWFLFSLLLLIPIFGSLYLGYRDNIHRYYQHNNLFVSPTIVLPPKLSSQDNLNKIESENKIIPLVIPTELQFSEIILKIISEMTNTPVFTPLSAQEIDFLNRHNVESVPVAPLPVQESQKTLVDKVQLGDPLGGVQDSNNKWLQADLSKIVVSPIISQDQLKLKSIDSEMEEVAKFLTTKANPAEAPYLRFFTFYSMPNDPAFSIGVNGVDTAISLRQAGLLVLSFVLNSTANIERSQGNIITPNMLPGSDTICYINIEDFGWNADQWDRISKVDPYVVEPLIQHSAYNLGRLVGGNMLFRGDWFISNATDVQRQADAKISELIYYTLLFDKNTPKNGNDFRKALGVDLVTALKDNLDRRVIMESGKSSVSIETGGNRKIQGIRTPFGYYWETFDTKSLDFFNNLDADDKLKDAGEIIASHKNGMQVYLLVNQDDDRVDFADNGLVEDTNPLGKKSTRPTDRRVRTATSCIVCHSNGINPVSNSLVESLEEGVQLNVLAHTQNDTYKDYQEFRKSREKYLRLDRKYVNNGINAVIDADNRLYEQAVRQSNGLITSQNSYLFWAVRSWYDKPLDLRQAAVECGVTPSEYVEKTQGSISVRINRIVASDSFSIPRKYWESLNPAGDYAHSILTIKLHSPEQVKIAIGNYPGSVGIIPTSSQKMITAMFANVPISVTDNGIQQSLGFLQKGDQILYSKFDGEWYQVKYNGRYGFIHKSHCVLSAQ